MYPMQGAKVFATGRVRPGAYLCVDAHKVSQSNNNNNNNNLANNPEM